MYKSGTDLILSLGGKPLGFSTTCKISDSAQTADRATKEADTGLFTEKYVKSISEQITTEGFEYKGSRTPYADLKALMINATPVTLNYCYVGETKGYQGTYIITSLDLDGQAGEDSKFSITFESTGAVVEATMTQTRTEAKVTGTAPISAPAASPSPTTSTTSNPKV